MRLSYRDTHPRDLKEALSIAFDRFAYSKADQPRLLSFWNFLITKKMARSVVIEDREKPSGAGIVSFGISVFAKDAFMKEAKSTLSPPLSRHLFRRWWKGNRDFLNPKEIAVGNVRKELNLLVPSHGWRLEPPAERQAMVQAKLIETFFPYHAGYGIKDYVMDTFSEEEKDISLGQGTELVRDYTKNPGTGIRTPLPRPMFLVGASRKQVNPGDNLLIWSFLNAPTSRFGFSAGEKEVLERAMLGETDREIARVLRLTVWAVKKRWQGVYEKVEKADSHVLAPVKDSSLSPGEDPKIERRRFMLDYLRQHLEEIRPTPPSPRQRRSRNR